MYPEAYLEGIRLFNAGYFWHSHEQWEACWLASSEPDATYYKGIIQAAAALVHWQKANPRGLHLNWAKSRAKLATLPDVHMGLDVRGFCRAMEQFVVSHEAGDSPQPPQIVLLAQPAESPQEPCAS